MLALVWQVLPAMEKALKKVYQSRKSLLQRVSVHHQGNFITVHFTVSVQIPFDHDLYKYAITCTVK